MYNTNQYFMHLIDFCGEIRVLIAPQMHRTLYSMLCLSVKVAQMIVSMLFVYIR